MAYCTVDDIKSEFKTLTLVSDTDSGISEADVTEFIEQESATIDIQISNCFVLPLDTSDTANATTLSVLKKACIWLVADRIVPILQIKSRDRNIEQSGQKEITYWMKATSLLNRLCPAKGTGQDSPARKESSLEVDYSSEVPEACFKRDVEQW